MTDLDDRHARLEEARLYLVCDLRPGGRPLEDVLAPALAGGVDVVQLRDKHAAAGCDARRRLRRRAQRRCHNEQR